MVSRRAKRGKVLFKALRPVETMKLFSSLAEKVGLELAGKERKGSVDAGSLSQGRLFVLGHSQVRHLDCAFCAKDSKRRTRVCLPGIRYHWNTKPA